MGLRTALGLKRLRSAKPPAPKFTDYIHERINGREPGTPWMSKVGMVTFAARLGLRVPETLAIYDNPADFNPENLPERFVLKPTEWWSTKGVMLLRRADGGFFDQLRKRNISLDEIRSEQSDHQSSYLKMRPGTDPKIIAEEIIEDESGDDIIPFDYKLYTFAGKVRFIVQIDRNDGLPKLAFYRDGFAPLDFNKHMESKLQKARRGHHRLPHCWLEMLSAAKEISLALRTPFISVDTYASTKGVAIGELTPTPGGAYFGMWRFKPWYNEQLGTEWAKASQKLHPARRSVFTSIVTRAQAAPRAN